MTWLVALLTLTALPAGPIPSHGAPAAETNERPVERVALPKMKARPTLRVRALEALLVLEAPRASAPLARALRLAKRALCPTVEERPGEVRLHCATRFLEARLLDEGERLVLEVWESTGLPSTGVDAPAIFAFDPPALGLGDPCPGSTASGRAECRLSAGDLSGARVALEEIVEGPPRSHAELRLGDLDAARGDLDGARAHFGAVERSPYRELAEARRCELALTCLSGAKLDELYATRGLPGPLRQDQTLRRARALAFLGRPVEAARLLVTASSDEDVCALAPTTCQRVLDAALRDAGPDGAEMLAAWAELPAREKSPDAWETDLAAAELADRTGAPSYAANLLAASAGRVPPYALLDYLLRTAELYLKGKDPIRAGVVLEFARGRVRHKELPGARWAAVIRGVRGQGGAAAPAALPPPARGQEDEALLAAARRAVESARALSPGGTP